MNNTHLYSIHLYYNVNHWSRLFSAFRFYFFFYLQLQEADAFKSIFKWHKKFRLFSQLSDISFNSRCPKLHTQSPFFAVNSYKISFWYVFRGVCGKPKLENAQPNAIWLRLHWIIEQSNNPEKNTHTQSICLTVFIVV